MLAHLHNITYCANIHPGESWEETFISLRGHLPVVKDAFSPTAPFPVGLRLSARAARELDAHAEIRFLAWLRQHDLFVPTINGFPYGSFHGSRVKEQVYHPDWRRPERADYTMRLATLLDRWLPSGIRGSISTVPICFGRYLPEDEREVVRNNLLRTLEHFDHLRRKSGKTIVLALEPEPGCLLETIDDVVSFCDRLEFSDSARTALGICFDCCHHAVEFESPEESLGRLVAAGISVGKVQVSSALRLFDPDRTLLEGFREPTYLHQTVIRDRMGGFQRYNDLSEALRMHQAGRGDEWRIHFHLPIFVEQTSRYGTTRCFIDSLLPFLDHTTQLEVETYTWDVLPPELKTDTVDQSNIRELKWLQGARDASNRRP